MQIPADRCGGKRIYQTFTSAKRGSENLNKNDEKAQSHAYACNHCGRYHVGRNRERDRRKTKEIDGI